VASPLETGGGVKPSSLSFAGSRQDRLVPVGGLFSFQRPLGLLLRATFDFLFWEKREAARVVLQRRLGITLPSRRI